MEYFEFLLRGMYFMCEKIVYIVYCMYVCMYVCIYVCTFVCVILHDNEFPDYFHEFNGPSPNKFDV